MEATLERALDKAWGSTCRVLFKQELGERGKFESWLCGYLPAKAERKSHLSGKGVIVANDAYPASARFVSEDELVQNRDYALDINQIKDIDSIVEGIREQCEYTGNRYLGNSAFVESSDIVIDSQYVSNSTNIEQSQYVDSSYMMRRGSKCIFGSGWTANGEFLLRVVAGLDIRRCFESHFITSSADLYFCFNCDGCQEMLFSFGQKNKNHVIGNVALPREKYALLKAKLIQEVAEELKKNRKFDSLFEMAPGRLPKSLPKISLPGEKGEESMEAVEKAFSSTFEVVLKKKPGSITGLEGWLAKHTVQLEEVKTPFGNTTYLPLNFGVVSEMPKSRLVTIPESFALGEFGVREESFASLRKMVEALDGIAFFSAEYSKGENFNIIKTPLVLHSVNAYRGYEATYSENTGLTSLSLHSKNVYGCHRIIDSQFAVKCYNSLYLNRCFELDSCSKCSDSYFCHNSEGLSDCMFCFNMKGRRHFIGNTEVEKEKYAGIKSAILQQIGTELDRKKNLKWDIFNIGAR